jgi:hypothetical protein
MIFKGSLNRPHFFRALRLIRKLLPQLPGNLEIHIIDNLKACPFVSPDIPSFQRVIFQRFCAKERISFSYSYGDTHTVVIWVTPEKPFLRSNVKATAGLMAHELMHTLLRVKGLDARLTEHYLESYEKLHPMLRELPFGHSRIIGFFDRIGGESVMTLKEIYANMDLLKRGCGEYLLEYYYNKIGTEKYCPMPVFYKGRLKEAHLDQIEKAILFQLSLMSAGVPFEHYGHPMAKALIKHMERCYERNIADITKEMHDVRDFVLKNLSNSPAFHKSFFKRVFLKAYKILL